jgi:hypothetical protein
MKEYEKNKLNNSYGSRSGGVNKVLYNSQQNNNFHNSSRENNNNNYNNNNNQFNSQQQQYQQRQQKSSVPQYQVIPRPKHNSNNDNSNNNNNNSNNDNSNSNNNNGEYVPLKRNTNDDKVDLHEISDNKIQNRIKTVISEYIEFDDLAEAILTLEELPDRARNIFIISLMDRYLSCNKGNEQIKMLNLLRGVGEAGKY